MRGTFHRKSYQYYKPQPIPQRPKQSPLNKVWDFIKCVLGAGLSLGVIVVVIGVIILIPYFIPNFPFIPSTPLTTIIASVVNLPVSTTISESQSDITYINSIRSANGVNPIKFDSQVYNLAMARVNDMDEYQYLDHTNPSTGKCAYSLRSKFGLSPSEYVAENAFGYTSGGGGYYSGIEKEAINAWMTDRGHKYNILYPHISGAVACSTGGHCVFIGLNYDRFTDGCYSAAQGESFWASVGRQPYEHT